MLHQIFVAVLLPRLFPDAAAFLHEPQAGDVLQEPRRAADASFVREIELEQRSLMTGCGVSTPISDQVPLADVAPVGPLPGLARRGHGDDGAGRVVRAGRHIDVMPAKPVSSARRTTESCRAACRAE